MNKNEDVIETLDIEMLAEIVLEDEAANNPDPDTIDVELLEVEGVSE